MKPARPIALGAAALLIAGSTLLVGTSAAAADFYVDADDFVTEVSPYPAQWFIGDRSTGTLSSTPSGLNLDASAGLIQILNGTPTTSSLGALVDGADFTLVRGNANFQIPLFTDGDLQTGYTTLRPDNFGPVGLNPLAGWTTSGDFGTLPAESSHTIPEYEAELVAMGTTPEILAFGLISPLGENAHVASITWDGNTHWFLPQPTATISAATITVSEFAATGVTATFTGFIPGETVEYGYGTATAGSYLGDATADANGAVTVPFTTASTTTAAGTTYTISAFGLDSDVAAQVSFDLVADAPAVPGAPAGELAYGGVDATVALIVGGVLLLLGAGAVTLTALRRRNAA